MTGVAHEVLQQVHAQIRAARMVMRDTPERIDLHPVMLENVLLDPDHLRHVWLKPDRPFDTLLGIPVHEDWRLPEDVIVVRGPGRRMVVLRKVETTQYRAIVRDAVRRAHPWLKLPPPVPPPEGTRWASWVFEAQPLPRPWFLLDGEGGRYPFSPPQSFVTGAW